MVNFKLISNSSIALVVYDYLIMIIILWSLYHFIIVEVKAECEIDNDCQRSEKCNKGSCIEACRLTYCGANALCESGYHSAKCACLPGYTGDPRTSCNRCKFEAIEH